MIDETILVSTKIYPADTRPFSGYIKILRGRIVEISTKKLVFGPNVIDVGDNIIIPGLIDLHLHGSFGFDIASAKPNTISCLAQHLAKKGTTAFLPTLGATSIKQTEAVVRRVRDFMSKQNRELAPVQIAFPEARVLGLHLEGPFLNPRKKGAMSAEHLIEPSVELVSNWIDIGKGVIKRMTIAPELHGACELVSFLLNKGVTVAAGHTTANYQQSISAINWGVSAATHTYNAMPKFHHREPGIIGAIFADDRISAELLCDGVHIHPAAALAMVKAKTPSGVYLASDAITPAGLPPGSYTSLGKAIEIDREGRAFLHNGTIAGSTATLLDGMKNIMNWCGQSLDFVLPMVTMNPAKQIGVFDSKGSLRVGKDADIVVLDNNLNVLFTVVNGVIGHPKN